MLKVLIEGVGEAHGYHKTFEYFDRFSFRVASPYLPNKQLKSVLQGSYDLVLFTGGSDVNPALYGESNTRSHPHEARDQLCMRIYKRFIGKIPMVGICRGLQFLWVASGGKMIQHIENAHEQWHSIYVANGWLNKEGGMFETHTNSYHHQGLRLDGPIPEGWDIVATAEDGIVEAAVNFDLRLGGVQYHPEGMQEHQHGKKLFYEITDRILGG